jgi:hypothetical protein
MSATSKSIRLWTRHGEQCELACLRLWLSQPRHSKCRRAGVQQHSTADRLSACEVPSSSPHLWLERANMSSKPGRMAGKRDNAPSFAHFCVQRTVAAHCSDVILVVPENVPQNLVGMVA